MQIITGDSLEELKKLDSESIEALITDPPYGLSNVTTKNIQECLTNWLSGEKYEHQSGGFMGKAWDSFVPSPELWKEVYRVMKHGAHGLVFAGSRTQDLMSISLRLAGFEVRDTLMWVYGSGFPKSHNISKAIDKSLGAKPTVIGTEIRYNEPSGLVNVNQAKEWNGWGTALKPAYEPILLIRKPLKGTVAQNTLDFGCGGINIDATRIQYSEDENINFNAINRQQADPKDKGWSGHVAQVGTEIQMFKEKGRFPANVMIDEHVEHELMKRYFYCSKASKKEREAGLLHLDSRRANTHPTVKPLDLMRYLVKLITPPNGTVLDPFLGSGSTLCAVALEGKKGIGIEREPEYVEIAKARIKHWQPEEEPKSPLDKFMKG
jgi:DNA modification methylase